MDLYPQLQLALYLWPYQFLFWFLIAGLVFGFCNIVS